MSEDNRPVLKAKKTEKKPKDASSSTSSQKDSKSSPPIAHKPSNGTISASDLKKQMEEATNVLLKTLDNWDSDRDSTKESSNLRERIHDIRRVISRIEIQIAYAERERQIQSPIPAPRGRAGGRKKG